VLQSAYSKAEVTQSGRSKAEAVQSGPCSFADASLSAASVIHEAGKDYHSEWDNATRLPNYTGRSFLHLKVGGKRIPMRKKTAKVYIDHCNNDTQLLARFTRAIMNHAPIGSYYERFPHLKGDPLCKFCEPVQQITQTRYHILQDCSRYSRYWEDWPSWLQYCPDSLRGFVGFLIDNPLAFSFKKTSSCVPPSAGHLASLLSRMHIVQPA
jgi:hypothetical protein